MRAPTRNPWLAWHWIPDVETPDLIRGRDDKLDGWDDKWQVRDDKPDDSDDRLDDRDDKTEGRGTFAEPSTAASLASGNRGENSIVSFGPLNAH